MLKSWVLTSFLKNLNASLFICVALWQSTSFPGKCHFHSSTPRDVDMQRVQNPSRTNSWKVWSSFPSSSTKFTIYSVVARDWFLKEATRHLFQWALAPSSKVKLCFCFAMDEDGDVQMTDVPTSSTSTCQPPPVETKKRSDERFNTGTHPEGDLGH